MTDTKASTAEPQKLTRSQRLILEAGSKKAAPKQRIKIKPNKKLNIASLEIAPVDEADDTLDTISRKAQETGDTQSLGRQANKIVEKTKTGRPSLYSEEMAKRICEYLIKGNPLVPEKLREEGLPDPTTIFRWLSKHENFRRDYAHAREMQAHVYADETITIADTCNDAAKARVQIDARKWHAAHTNPKVWGDTQRVDINQQITVADAHASVLMRLADQAKASRQQVIETDYKDVTPR
jgi:hypothetical protein